MFCTIESNGDVFEAKLFGGSQTHPGSVLAEATGRNEAEAAQNLRNEVTKKSQDAQRLYDMMYEAINENWRKRNV